MPDGPEMFHANGGKFQFGWRHSRLDQAWRRAIRLVRLDSRMQAKRRSNARSSRRSPATTRGAHRCCFARLENDTFNVPWYFTIGSI